MCTFKEKQELHIHRFSESGSVSSLRTDPMSSKLKSCENDQAQVFCISVPWRFIGANEWCNRREREGGCFSSSLVGEKVDVRVREWGSEGRRTDGVCVSVLSHCRNQFDLRTVEQAEGEAARLGSDTHTHTQQQQCNSAGWAQGAQWMTQSYS